VLALHEGKERCKRAAIDYAMAAEGLMPVPDARRAALLTEAGVRYRLVHVHYRHPDTMSLGRRRPLGQPVTAAKTATPQIERWKIVPSVPFTGHVWMMNHRARTGMMILLYVEPWTASIFAVPLARQKRLVLLRRYRDDPKTVKDFVACLNTARRGGRALGRTFAKNYFASYFTDAAT
jgi:hypothetical protein